MPRNYGQTTTSIWGDKDFTGLALEEQAVYFMLKFQPEVTAAGTLALTYRRWAQNARDLTPGILTDHIDMLVKRGHLAIDEDTEELLIVKFIKWDKGYANSKRRPVIEDAARAIRSATLRAIVADELTRLGLSDMASGLGTPTPSDRASDTPPDRTTRFDRVVVKEGEYRDPNPLTATREGPQPASPIPSGASAEPPSMFCAKHPDGTEESCGACGTARKRLAAWNAERLAAEVAAKTEAARLRDACEDCDEKGFITDSSGRPVDRCAHPNVRRAS